MYRYTDNKHFIEQWIFLAYSENNNNDNNIDHMNKWKMNNPESVLENEMHKSLRDFEIQTDHLISARPLDLMIVDKKRENLPNSELCRSG